MEHKGDHEPRLWPDGADRSTIWLRDEVLARDRLRQGLRALGYVEGQNLVIEGRFHQGKIDRYPALVADLVGLPVDVIVCATTVGTTAARDGTRTIPIVMAGAANPMSAGLIASLARPGGNVTGVILQTADVTEKRIDLLHETLPNLRRVAAFYGGERTAPVVEHWVRDNERIRRLAARRRDEPQQGADEQHGGHRNGETGTTARPPGATASARLT